jgi:hypothetical protein
MTINIEAYGWRYLMEKDFSHDEEKKQPTNADDATLSEAHIDNPLVDEPTIQARVDNPIVDEPTVRSHEQLATPLDASPDNGKTESLSYPNSQSTSLTMPSQAEQEANSPATNYAQPAPNYPAAPIQPTPNYPAGPVQPSTPNYASGSFPPAAPN